MEPLLGTNCEETQSFLQLPETLSQLRIRLMDIGLSFINQLLLKGQSLRSLESVIWKWALLTSSGCGALPAFVPPFPGRLGSGMGQASVWKEAGL